MNEHTSSINEAFMEVISGKIAVQDKKITSLEEEIKNIPDNKEVMQKLINTIQALQDEIKNNRLPAEKLSIFFTRLDIAISLLKQPVEKKVVHQHHVPKIILISAGLFFALAIVCSGWYITAEKLTMYKANDTKYRYLKLDTASISLQNHLDQADSLYNYNTNLRETVLESEKLNQKHLEMLQKARQMESEATDLKRKIYTK